jgi:hypothetical protein
VHAKELIKTGYQTEGDDNIHLTAFGKRLDDKQICIKQFGINISNEDKLQYYLEQMYSCNQFDWTDDRLGEQNQGHQNQLDRDNAVLQRTSSQLQNLQAE